MIFLLTLAIAGVMLYSTFLGRTMTERYAPLIVAAMEIKLEVTTAHLWFEEIITGDRYADITEVWENLDQAQWHARAMLDGGENVNGKLIALEDPALRRLIEQASAGVTAFRALAQERWKTRSSSGIGSHIDQRFDKAFETLVAAADEVGVVLQRTIAIRLQRFHLAQALLVAIAVILGVFVAFVFQRYERRRARDMLSLREALALQKVITSNSPIGISIYDETGQCVSANDSIAQIIGAATEEVLEQNYNKVESWKESGLSDAAKSAVEERVTKRLALQVTSTFGKELGVDCYLVPFMQKGAVSLMLMVADSTERMRAEEVLLNEKRLSEEYINSLPGLFYVFDEQRLIRWNNKWKKITGYSDDELGGRNITDFFEGEDKLLVEDRILKVYSAGSAVAEAELVRKDGRRIPYYFTGVRKKLDGKDHLIGFGLDITERKRSEVEQERLRGELQQAQKMEVLGQLTGGIAHDFNNILGIILGYTELAESLDIQSDQAELTEYLGHVDKAAGRAKELVAQMLAYSRSEVRDDRPLVLQPLVEEDLTLLRSTLPASIEIKTEIEKGLPRVVMNPIQLNQLLMNLCTNARDAMEGRGSITVRLGWVRAVDAGCATCRKPIGGDWIELSVTDTGSGIKSDTLERIFDPYYTTKEVGKGTGMGLSVIQGIMHSQGGHILVATQPGRGTDFRLLFPPVVEEMPETLEAHPSSKELRRGDGEQVLVVDDELDLALFLGDLLESYGYRATVLANSQEALDQFNENPNRFDLLITDQTMPEMSGVELVKILRQTRPELPVILNTGFSEHVNAKYAAGMGVHYMEKPVNSEHLIQVVGELLAARRI